MQKLTGYKVSELKDCILAIHDLQLRKKCSNLTAIRDKYKQHKVCARPASCSLNQIIVIIVALV
jgi:hypothetical protein